MAGESRNEVVLVGRLAAPPQEWELPSGDVLTTWRLVVDRAPTKRPLPQGIRPTTVDALECVAWTSAVRRSAVAWQPGDVVAVEGALRRRFWRGPAGGGTSRYEIEVVKAKRLARAT